MSDRERIHEEEFGDVVAAGEHLTEIMQVRYVAALLAGVANSPAWAHATEHLANCAECAEGALDGARQLWDSPNWRLLEMGEFARRAEELWIRRLRGQPRAAVRQAAAAELGALEPLGIAGFAALVQAAVEDRDDGVRATAAAALAEANRRLPIARRVREGDAVLASSQG
ncbi:MAG TPA: hypothetical protein VF715_01310 [Thermoleophilaceae bacterium]|jgi:hypothetical protein